MSNDISKEEYLKRYLADGNQEKKRKKKVKSSKSIIPRIKIIDKDISIKTINFGTNEVVEEEEENPIVAEVIDDRPTEVKLKEIYSSSKWKTLGEENVKSFTSACSQPSHSQNSTKPSKDITKSNPTKRHDSDRDSDLSPARVTQRHDSDSDYSPPRKQNSLKKISKTSQKSRNSHYSKSKASFQKHNSDNDLSPERTGRLKSISINSDSDLSPERNIKSPMLKNESEDADSDLSPPRKTSHHSKGDKRPTKTLSGLKAGLQNATTLRKETKELRQREKEQIKELDEELSGRHADTIVRDRKTGKKRDIDAELQIDEEKEKKKQEQQQKYAEWGKGLEQTENKKIKLSEDLHEMSKPLARYCNDEDLENHLKDKIYDDDPMAQYMRKKKQKTAATSVYPTYSGPPPPPNRFQIIPGYRWDGVDRSNGFEKKYFEQHSNKKAAEEEAYLWSIQDM